MAAAAAVMGLGAALWAADSAPGAFTVGVLRRDGVIVPFAAFDGKRWSNRWPPPALDSTVPVGSERRAFEVVGTGRRKRSRPGRP